VFIKILKEIDFIERDNVLMCYHVLYCPTQRHWFIFEIRGKIKAKYHKFYPVLQSSNPTTSYLSLYLY